MAAQYSNRQFFRKVSNQYLNQYFEAKGVSLDVDFSQLKENDSENLQNALHKLADDQVTDIEAEFQQVNALACESGMVALVDEARLHNDTAFVEALALIEGFHTKAMWAFLSKPDYWRGAAMFLRADNVSPSYWKKRNDLPRLPPHVEERDIQTLAKAIGEFFYSKEGRGKNCAVELYRRNDREFFFAYPEDFAQTVVEWVGNTLKSRVHHPAFEIIFVYCQTEGSLDIYTPKSIKALPDLQRIFAQHILKLAVLEAEGIDKRVYELTPIIEDDFEFRIEPDSGIRSVVVTQLRLNLQQGNKWRITLEADVHKDQFAVYTLLKALNLPSFYVSQITFKVLFEPTANRRGNTRTVNITHSNSCSLNHDGGDLKIRQMLAKSGIEPKAMSIEVGAVDVET